MRAIDILFSKINELNSQIISSNDINKKVSLVIEIKDVADIIKEISMYYFEHDEKEYL